MTDQSRKWLITIDNVDIHQITHDDIKKSLEKFSLDYWCMADEKTADGMLHTHVFMESGGGIRFTTVKKRFPKIAHIDNCVGTARENRDYILKQGKYANTEKAETSIEGTFEEEGIIDSSDDEVKIDKNEQLIGFIKAGLSNTDILKIAPQYCFRIKDIDLLRQTLLFSEQLEKTRNITVTYLYGAPGTGKTRSIYSNHNPKDIYRITNYRNGTIVFDGYTAQEVLVFEEFNSQISIEEMLNLLDIYPLTLPARYNDKIACYTIVYITSNKSLDQQYYNIQRKFPDTWAALNRRIHNIVEFKSDGTKVFHKQKNLLEGGLC